MKRKSSGHSDFFSGRVLIGSRPLKCAKRIFTSQWRHMLSSLFFLGAAIAVLAVIGSSPVVNTPDGPHGRGTISVNKIAPWVIDHTTNGQQAQFIVVLVNQANLRPAEALETKSEKGRFVHDALWNKSRTTRARPPMAA
jgi:hypothetical protein